MGFHVDGFNQIDFIFDLFEANDFGRVRCGFLW
jgi:hypothetical protein